MQSTVQSSVHYGEGSCRAYIFLLVSIGTSFGWEIFNRTFFFLPRHILKVELQRTVLEQNAFPSPPLSDLIIASSRLVPVRLTPRCFAGFGPSALESGA